ncbi:hypothetical protein ACFSJY_00910 [Thalassotalea euphylliae]|uniref:hypothetical protein n=1 Tax=Thalassotalea euphylliae TaxID=1655234 RepID=UPI003637BE41
MKLQHFLAALFALSTSVAAYAGNTTHYQFFENQLGIALPTELKQLSNNALNKRYGKQSVPPSFAFTDGDNSVSFTFTQYPTPASKKDMNKIHKSISNMLRKASGKASWKKDKVYTRLGTKIAVYEYETKGVGKYQYNLTYALPVNGQLTFISFITTDKKYKKKWLALARESLETLELEES